MDMNNPVNEVRRTLDKIRNDYADNCMVIHKSDDGCVEVWDSKETELLYTCMGTRKIALRIAKDLELEAIKTERKLTAWFNVDGSKRGYRTHTNNGGI